MIMTTKTIIVMTTRTATFRANAEMTMTIMMKITTTTTHVGTKKKQECKCHGMSGSCTLKTCWMRLPSFRTVGTALKDRFDGASKVLQGNSVNRGDRRKRSRRFNLIPVDSNHKPPSLRDLVYYENSPNYCERDNSIGFKGTRGRECNATSIGVDGCDLMCCDRGYRSVTYTARERCDRQRALRTTGGHLRTEP
ncbi:Protein Wnt-1 [Lamellibrachia satsuma]|nr:Protein Wnt-1 [Lamellibrachia satsuma]